MTTATRLRLVALVLLLTSCARASESAPYLADQVLSRNTLHLGPGPEVIERFVFSDGTTCYRYFHTGSNGWSCVRAER